MKSEQISRPARPRSGPPAQRSSKAVKIGKSSYMLDENTHSALARLAAKLQSTMPCAMRYALVVSLPILADLQDQVARIFAERCGWIDEPPEMVELRQQYCRASSLDEMAARMSAEMYGLELLQQGGWRRFDEGRGEQQAEIRDIRAVAR